MINGVHTSVKGETPKNTGSRDRKSTKPTTCNYAINVENLSKHYGSVVAVDSLTFSIQPGKTCALLGGNGAGKTTTIAMLLGLVAPTGGAVEVMGIDMLRNRYRILPRMNFSSPYVDLPQRLTVVQNLKVYARLYGVRGTGQRLRSLKNELDLGDLMRRKYGTLSAGQRTRVALAKALLNRPDVLLLDEPTASLDPDTADRIRVYLQRYREQTGATIVIASHNMPEVERLCDDVIMLRQGRIVSRGTPAELIEHYGRRTMEEVFLDIARLPEGSRKR